jgi:AsmA protein
MKKALIALAAVIGVVIVAAVAIPFLIPTETWKSQIEQRASAATGRKLTIDGPVRLSLLPSVALVASDVALSNAPGARDPAMVTLAKLEIAVRLMPLLSGELAIDRFVIEKPVIHLEVDRQGKANWDFASASAAPPSTPTAPSSSRAPARNTAQNIALGDVRLSDGIVTYTDARTDSHYEVSAINAAVDLPDLDHPFKVDGSFVWNNEKVGLTGEVTVPKALLNGGRSNLGVAIHSNPLTAEIKGTATATTPAKFDGTLDLSSPSVRNLAAWMGKKLPVSGDGLGPLAISGKLAADGAKVSFTDAAYKLDALEAHGNLSVDNGGRVPYVKATLATNMLDLNPYLGQPQQGSGAPTTEKAAPQTPAAAAQQGWSAAPIDLSGLKAVNADLALTTDGLAVHDIKLGKSTLNVSLKDGKMMSDLVELALYQGSGKGRFTVDGSGNVPATALDLHLAGIQAEPFLKDTMGFDSLRGTAHADVTLAASGPSQRALVSALNGKGAIKLQNGAVRGLDLGSMIRNIGSAFSSAQGGNADETTFADATATFTVTNGIARNDDLTLQSPFFRATGKGTANLPERTLNYRVEPKLVASSSGQGGSKNGLGVAVPVVISGPWNKLNYQPDLAGVLSVDPEGTVKGLMNLFRGGSNSDSGNAQQPSGGTQAPPSSNPIDRLKNLFGR